MKNPFPVKGHVKIQMIISFLEKAGGTHENLYQLFDGLEYAKLGINEKDLPHSWGFWNRPSPGL